MQKMGGMGGIMGLMPGMAGMKDKMSAAGLDDRLFGRQIAIISSMTRAERANPDILKHSRKKRIAAGSGTDAADINKLLKMHRQMADMMKMMGGKKGGMMKQMMGGLAGKMGLGGLGGGMGGMPDLSKMDPKQLEALAKQAEAAGIMPVLAAGACPASAACRVFPACRRRSEDLRHDDRSEGQASTGGIPAVDRQYRRCPRAYARRTLPLHQGGGRAEGDA
jgi:signal recognition particle subunit SRP54